MWTVIVDRPGDRPYELTPTQDSLRFGSAVPGGFGAGSFAVSGDQAWKADRLVPKNATVRVMWGTTIAWEGLVEDHSLDALKRTNTVTCFGKRRLLEGASLKRIWSLRSIPWQAAVPVTGLDLVNALTPTFTPATMFCTVGQFDPTDRTRIGVIADNYQGVATADGDANWGIYTAPSGISIRRVNAKVSNPLHAHCFAQAYIGNGWSTEFDKDCPVEPTQDYFTCPSNTSQILLGSMSIGSGHKGVWEDIRILCTALEEDVIGGMYADNLIRDLVSLVPGLQARLIESIASRGFPITSLARPVRDSALSVLEEIAAMFSNEWTVWEDGYLDWMPASLDEPQWVATIDMFDKLQIDSSVADIAESIYLLYEDAASGEPSEAVASSSSERNPYVKSPYQKDLVVQAPVVMTPRSAARLADLVAQARGDYPTARGTGVVPADVMVQHASGHMMPAALIRAGQNLTVPDLPKTDTLAAGSDGQTLFHITAVDTDLKSNRTTFTFDSYNRRIDVVFARVAAVTRVLTG